MAEEKKQHHCDCGCDHDDCGCGHDDHDCDCGCDCGHDEDIVMLQDEEGNDLPFHYITTLEYEGKEYVFLQPLDSQDDDELIVEILELQSVEQDGEIFDSLYPVDDELYDILYNELLTQIVNETNQD